MPVLLASLVPARPSPPAHCVRTSRTPSRHLPLRRMVTGRTRRNGGDAAAPPARSLPFSATEAGPAPPSFPDDRPVLFVHTLCPYAERAWLAFLEKGVPFHLVHIDLAAKPSWYRSINSRGLVPAVSYAGEVHVESLDICRWVDATFTGTSAGACLTPTDPKSRKEIDSLILKGFSIVDAGLSFTAGRSARGWGIGSGQSPAQRAALEDHLCAAIAEPIRRSGGPFLMGPEVSLADIAVFPFVRRFAVAARACDGGVDIVRDSAGGAVGRWLAALEARPAFQISAADDSLLLDAYKKHMSLDFFDYDSYSVFKLHPHNAAFVER